MKSWNSGAGRRWRIGRYYRSSCIALLAVILTGCSALPAVGPDYQAPTLALPAVWQGAGDVAVDRENAAKRQIRWWQQFNDPLLDRLVEQAVADSLDLKAAEARLRQARAARQQARGGYFPTVGVSAGGSRTRNASSVSALPTRTLYDAGFDASWEIDVFGGTRRAVEAAGADLDARIAERDQVQVSLVAEVASSYVDLRAYQRRLGIARDNLASQTETAQITDWRWQAGLASEAEVEQARTSREQTRASIPDLEVGLAEAEHRLATLLAQAPGALHEMLSAPTPFPEPATGVAVGIPSDVLTQRPDIIAAERTLAAETARVGQTLAQRYPSLNLGASFGWQAYGWSALGGSASLVRAVSGTLAATLFDGGRLRSAVDVQNAVQDAALVAYQSAVLAALEEVENALVAHAQARERVAARQAAALSARNAAMLSQQQYLAGLSDFQKVLETQRTQLSAQDALASAQAAVLSSLIQLYKALGGGWAPPAGAPQEGT